MDWETEHYGQRLASAASEEAASEVVLRREMAHQRSDGVPLLESKKMRPTPMSVELRRSRSETASAVNSLIATSRGMDEELEQELAEMDAEPSIGAFSVDADADADADADPMLSAEEREELLDLSVSPSLEPPALCLVTHPTRSAPHIVARSDDGHERTPPFGRLRG